MKKILLALSAMIALLGCSSTKKTDDRNDRKIITGGYSEHRQLNAEDLKFFNEVSESYGGLELTPITVSTQVVAGFNYCYRCKNKKGKFYEVTIFQPLPEEGQPIITKIYEVGKTSKPTNVLIVYYDAEVGTAALDAAIQSEGCEVVYRYGNINAYAVRIKKESTRSVLEGTTGVLSVADDQIMQLRTN